MRSCREPGTKVRGTKVRNCTRLRYCATHVPSYLRTLVPPYLETSHAHRSWSAAPSERVTLRRAMARAATSRNLSTRYAVRSSPVPQLNGGTYLGGSRAPYRLLPAPTTVPVFSSRPIPVFTWSPRKQPTFSSPVSVSPCGVHRRTGP